MTGPWLTECPERRTLYRYPSKWEWVAGILGGAFFFILAVIT